MPAASRSSPKIQKRKSKKIYSLFRYSNAHQIVIIIVAIEWPFYQKSHSVIAVTSKNLLFLLLLLSVHLIKNAFAMAFSFIFHFIDWLRHADGGAPTWPYILERIRCYSRQTHTPLHHVCMHSNSMQSNNNRERARHSKRTDAPAVKLVLEWYVYGWSSLFIIRLPNM